MLEIRNYLNKHQTKAKHVCDRQGNNILCFAVQHGNLDICELLIKSGIPINNQNVCFSINHLIYMQYEGNTALHFAIAYKKFRIMKLLIDSGANEMLFNDNHKGPWDGI